MSENSDRSFDQAGAFTKLWTDSLAKILQAATSFSPDAVPPEMLRQIRTGMFQALASSWDEFMRSPQFLEGMKQMMDQATAFRTLTSDFLTKARHEMQGTAREDVDSLMLALRHMENRILDKVTELAGRVETLQQWLDAAERGKPAPASRPPGRKPRATKTSSRKR